MTFDVTFDGSLGSIASWRASTRWTSRAVGRAQLDAARSSGWRRLPARSRSSCRRVPSYSVNVRLASGRRAAGHDADTRSPRQVRTPLDASAGTSESYSGASGTIAPARAKTGGPLAVERRRDGHLLAAGVERAAPVVDPVARRQVDRPRGRARLDDRRDQEVRPEEVGLLFLPGTRVVGRLQAAGSASAAGRCGWLRRPGCTGTAPGWRARAPPVGTRRACRRRATRRSASAGGRPDGRASSARPGRQLEPAQPQLALLVVRQVGLDVAGHLGVPVRKATQAERQRGRHHRLQAVGPFPAHHRVAVPLRALEALRADARRTQEQGEVAVWVAPPTPPARPTAHTAADSDCGSASPVVPSASAASAGISSPRSSMPPS